MERWLAFLASQIWHIPFLVLYIVGVVFALSRRDMGKASSYAAIGFGLMILGQLLSALSMFDTLNFRAEGGYDYGARTRRMMMFAFPTIAANLGGLLFIMAAIFARRPAPPPRVE
jgi:hypothetical protein